jgi:hypothetical protein
LGSRKVMSWTADLAKILRRVRRSGLQPHDFISYDCDLAADDCRAS